MKRTSLLLTLVLLLTACGPVARAGAITSCQATLDGMSAMVGGLKVPDHFRNQNPAKIGNEFDVMEYFKVLDHLSVQPGTVLDYVYHYDGMGGYPVLYARPAAQPAYATEADLPVADKTPNYLDSVKLDDTPESYFQLVVLSMLGNHFYSFWHAGYNDREIVCDKTGVSGIVASLNGEFGYPISPVARVQALLLKDVEPYVSIGEQVVEVRLVTFSKWGGFYSNTYTISRKDPHTLQDPEQKILVPYDCGVMF
jgi:hypothetical protein